MKDILNGILPKCPYCKKHAVVKKHGFARSGLRRYRCVECNKTFQNRFIYDGYREKQLKSFGAD
ncbi:MAG: hypothetical protein LBN41_07345 [Enterobacteriaceae bacterium]|jgi:transposase-like protein|nr:hypothetical protein [Enterobacteriaceae bacterium]